MKRRKNVYLASLIGFVLLAGCNESGRPLSDGNAGPAFNGQAPVMGVKQGETYVVAAGDTVATIADRTNTPVRTLIDLNNLQPPYILQSGQRLSLQPGASTMTASSGDSGVPVGQSIVMPAASADGSAAPTTAPNGGVTKAVLAPLGTASGTAQATGTTAQQTLTSAQQTAQQTVATATQAPQVLQTKTIVTQPMTAAGNAATTATTAANTAASTATTTVNNAVTKATTPMNGEPTVAIPDFPDATKATTAATTAGTAAATQLAAVTPASPAATGSGQFGWPVQGQVISKYGATADGLRNDGINISAPAGAPVVAAADGVVAYAGNELRGFGNMILIRHPDGWVTAYAHNQSLAVKKGDTVKRGQTIARVGQTGNVTAPQLHFEIRKGTSAQDPMKYLGS